MNTEKINLDSSSLFLNFFILFCNVFFLEKRNALSIKD